MIDSIVDTDSVELPNRPLIVAVIVEAPGASVLTRPVALTVATVVREELHVDVADTSRVVPSE
jgi:hypothetical protein